VGVSDIGKRLAEAAPALNKTRFAMFQPVEVCFAAQNGNVQIYQ
jgi:hypothetical protein